MLKTMRNNMKSLSWILWLLILAFVGFIFVQWGSGRFESEGLDRDVAAVGRQRISGEDFERDLTQSLAMYSKQFNNKLSRSLINQLGVAEQVLQGMVNALIIDIEADKLGLSISENELKDAIRAHPAFQRDGGFIGSEEYERLLAYNQVRVRDFEDNLKKELLADKLKELITCGLALDWGALEQEYRKENDKAELETIAFKSEAVTVEPAITESELESYYQDNKNSFKSPEKRAGQALIMKFADFKKEVAVAEKEAFAYFQKNRSLFKIAGKTKISRIWVPYTAQDREDVLKKMEATAAILNDANFADKARELSSDEKAKDGGDWGYWGWQNFSSQERTMIENLKPGGISSPIDVQQAFSILYAAEKVDARQETYGEVKARITGLLENEQLKKLVAEKIGTLYAKIKEANDLKRGENKRVTPLLSIGPLAAGDPIKNVDEMGYISQKLFGMRENEIAPPMEFPEGFAIIQLTRITKPEVEPFAQVRERVRTRALAAKKLQLQLVKAKSVAGELQRLADDKKIAAYLAKENLKAENATYQRGNQLSPFPVTPGLDESIFNMAENAYSPPLSVGSEAAVIVRVKSKKIVSAEEFAKQKEGFYQKKLAEAKNSMFGSYIMGRRNEHKISFNAEIFEKIKEYAVSRFH